MYGDWERSPDLIKPDDVFFATPEFYIGYGKENQIDISIRKPESVEAKFVRDIGKYYTKFRKNLRIPKAKWGEKSKTREYYDRRNDKLKRDFLWEKLQNPNETFERKLEKVLEQAKEEFGVIYPETGKKIVYSKKK